MKFYAPKYKQLDLGLLRSSLDELDKANRWVALGDLLPWTELEKKYNSRLDNQKKGAGNKPARMILGAMIIKHKLTLSDAETIEIIRESPYMQYFVDCMSSLINQYLTQVCSSRYASESQRMSSTRCLSSFSTSKDLPEQGNRDILGDFEIHSYCKPLVQPQKDPPSDEMKSRMARAIGERNEIEC